MQPNDPNNQPETPQVAPTPQINPMPSQPAHPVAGAPVDPNPQPTPTAVPPAYQSHAAHTTSTTQPVDYISNPFLNAVRGLVAILKSNPVPVMLAGLWFILAWIGFFIVMAIVASVINSSIIILVGVVAAMAGWMTIYGAYIDIAARSAADESITTSQAFRKGAQKILPLLGFSILAGLAVTVGLFLLIIPGVIIAARLSLAPLAMFEENLGVIASMKRSAELTKGHVNEMLGALFASMLMGSQGLLIGAIGLAPLVGRYRDLKALKESGAPKPKVHWLNYSYLLVIVFAVLYFALIASSISRLQESSKETQLKNNNINKSYQYDSYTSPSYDFDTGPYDQ